MKFYSIIKLFISELEKQVSCAY